MASIYKPTYIDKRTGQRKKARKWVIVYTDATGRRVKHPGYKDKKATEELARTLERDAERERAGLPVIRPAELHRTIAEARDGYLAELESLGRGTDLLKQVRLVADVMVRAEIRRLADATAEAISAHLIGLDVSRSSRAIYRARIRGMLGWCVRMGWLPANPCDAVARPGADSTRPKRALTLEEFRRLCEPGRPRRAVYAVAGLSGLRCRELRRLEWSDIDLTACRWHLRPEMNKARRRELLPMLPECKATLESLPGRRGLVFHDVPKYEQWHREFRRAGIAHKVDGRIASFHSLRYFFCTQLAKARIPITTVSRMMRHRNIRLTANLYLDLGVGDLEEDIGDFPMLLAPRPAPQEEKGTN